MKKKTIEPASQRIESYFKTENTHYNNNTFQLYQMAVESQLFEDIEPVLELFDQINILVFELIETPIEAVERIKKTTAHLNERQRAFVGLFSIYYLKNTKFDGERNHEPIIRLLEIEVERLAKPFLKAEKTTATTLNLRQRLKIIVDERLDKLPELIDQLEPKEQMNALLKMASLVLPRTETISHSLGEPGDFDFSFSVADPEPSPLKKMRSLKIEAQISKK